LDGESVASVPARSIQQKAFPSISINDGLCSLGDDSKAMTLLVTSFVAALALWSLLHFVVQRIAIAPNPIQAPRPDSLYFELRTGLIIAAGIRVSQLLGYPRAADCLAQFDRVVLFKNASLV
jgi:hypothetical protein